MSLSVDISIRVILGGVRKVPRTRRPRKVRVADSAQQIVGGSLLAGPFVVTEEVWLLAENTSLLQTVATIGVVCGTGYATLFKADTNSDPTTEQRIARVPVRFLSLMMVAFGSVTIPVRRSRYVSRLR